MTTEQKKESILGCADENGRIRFGGTPPSEALELVGEGRLVRLSYFTFSLPYGG